MIYLVLCCVQLNIPIFHCNPWSKYCYHLLSSQWLSYNEIFYLPLCKRNNFIISPYLKMFYHSFQIYGDFPLSISPPILLSFRCSFLFDLFHSIHISEFEFTRFIPICFPSGAFMTLTLRSKMGREASNEFSSLYYP